MSEIKNLRKATNRIKKAIKEKENIILYGDTDLDGATSVLILEEAIKNLSGRVSNIYFPDREKEGYGLGQKALILLKKRSPGLLILLDCGISNFKELKLAKALGFETIIIDHHEIINNKVPLAYSVIDPKQKGDKYPFKFLATCGLVFKLVQVLLQKKMSEILENSFLELVALGTIADMMVQTQENKKFIERGLLVLPFTFRPGLRVFLEFFKNESFSTAELAQKIVPVLQVSDCKGHLVESYLLLSSHNEAQAKELFEILYEKHKKRQVLLFELTGNIIDRVRGDNAPIIFEGGKEIPYTLAGSLASRVCNHLKKPTFIFHSRKELTRGSVRVPEGINSVQALEQCQELLEMYGGHPPASGFTVKNKNLQKFKECLERYFSS